MILNFKNDGGHITVVEKISTAGKVEWVGVQTNLKKIVKWIKKLPSGIYTLEVLDYKNSISRDQQKFYWKVIIPRIMEFFNSYPRKKPMNIAEAHLQFKELAGLYTDVQVYDEKKVLVEKRLYASLSQNDWLTTKDFMEALERVNYVIMELSGGSYVLPEPDPSLKRKSIK